MVSNIKILVCPDKFKASLMPYLSDTIEEELLKINFYCKKCQWQTGDGTIDILQRIVRGDKIYCRVFDPLFRDRDIYLSNGDSAAILKWQKQQVSPYLAQMNTTSCYIKLWLGTNNKTSI